MEVLGGQKIKSLSAEKIDNFFNPIRGGEGGVDGTGIQEGRGRQAGKEGPDETR